VAEDEGKVKTALSLTQIVSLLSWIPNGVYRHTYDVYLQAHRLTDGPWHLREAF
jgi:hypothetical protein